MEEIYDLAILGAGPAGICAAIYATRGKLNTLWLEKKFVQGGQIVDTYEVDNYPGLPGITGLDLGETMVKHAEKLGIKPKREPVLSIEDEGEVKVIRTKKNQYPGMWCGSSSAWNSGRRGTERNGSILLRDLRRSIFPGWNGCSRRRRKCRCRRCNPSFQNMQEGLSCAQKR